MQVAIIDLGTNTFNLLVAKLTDENSFEVIFQDKLSVKLGEGGINTNTILPIPFQRGISAFEQHLKSAKKFNSQRILAFGTSALRSSLNGNDFVREIKRQFNIEINVIDGNEEAELIYEGVRMALPMLDTNSLIMDIGGGSTEFIIANKKTLVWKQSFDLGAARLLEKFNPSEPITQHQIAELENYFDKQLVALDKAIQQYSIAELIGSSGSFDTFAEIINCRLNLPIDWDKESSYIYKMNDYYALHEQLLKSTKEQRLATPGLIEMRVDMIVVSTIFTNYILKKYSLQQMRLSTYALKEGVISKLMKDQEYQVALKK